MAISDLRITAEDTYNKKISDIEGDTLVGTPSDNKAKFDEYCELIKERFNDLVDSINDCFTQNGSTYKINTSAINNASDSRAGLMTSADKEKLDEMLVQVAEVTSGLDNPPTSGAVWDAIQTIAGIGTNIADYVVSLETLTPSSGSWLIPWRIRKWNSGVCEAWLMGTDATGGASFTLASDVWISANDMYHVNLDRFRYPTNTFVAPPTEQVSLAYNNGDAVNTWIVPRGEVSEANRRYGTQAYRLLRAKAPSGNTTHTICIYSIGRWK